MAGMLFLDKTGVRVGSFASKVDLHFCSHHPFLYMLSSRLLFYVVLYTLKYIYIYVYTL